jgi:cytochrome d ubiquinol oxidase subunit I
MNQPQGFELDRDGNPINVDPIAALLNDATVYEFPHMLLAAYMVTGFGLASLYAISMLRDPSKRSSRRHRLGLMIPLAVGAIAAPIQIFVGDVAARGVAEDQPAKFAAFECIEETGPNQTEYIGGICTDDGVKYGIGIPGLDSWLVGFSTDTVVTGLDQIPDDEEPPSNTLLHLAFDAMVGVGFGLLALGSWFGFAWWRRRDLPETKWFLRGVAVSGVGAVVALESGWIVTEVGRQPWIVYEQMRVSEAVTSAGGLWWWFGGAIALYAALGTAAAVALRILVRRDAEGDTPEVPYGPPGGSPPGDREPAGASP